MTTTPTLELVAPGDLILERNIRTGTTDLADLQKSIAELGVLEPIVAVRNPDGGLVVRHGHRRTLAAVAADATTVPVYVIGENWVDDEAEVQRIIAQRDENTARAGLSTADEIAIVTQLTAFGLSAAQIATRARLPKAAVTAAKRAAGSKLAAAATEKYDQLTLDQAAAIAEFEDDPATAEALVAAAVEGRGFDHVAQRARDDRFRRQEVARKTRELTDAGITVVDAPSWDAKTPKKLTGLADLDSKGERKPCTPRGHAKCPGHVAWVRAYGSVSNMTIEVEYGCQTPAQHVDRYGGDVKPTAAEMSPEEREKAKAERKLVIDNNKAWDSATEVRRAWLKQLAAGKTPPKGAAKFIATAMATIREASYDVSGHNYAMDLISSHQTPIEDLVEKGTDQRALLLALVQVLARYEAATSRMDWRTNGRTSRTGRYLRYLQGIGYELSAVEKYALNSKRHQ